jgi:hypothetical protein
MATRKDMMTPRPGSNGKTFWHRIGTAWEGDGGKISLVFDSLPLPTMNDKGQLETRVLLMEPRDNAAPQRGNGGSPRRAPLDDLDDEVPPFVTMLGREPGASKWVI